MSNVSNVTAAKPKVGGAIYRSPISSSLQLPTDATTALPNTFVSLGYIGEEGLINANNGEVEDVMSWDGDVVLSTPANETDTYKFKLIEALNIEVLKTVYGDGNVTGSLSAGISVEAGSIPQENYAYVVEMVLKGNVAKRIVIPSACVVQVGEITHKKNEPIGYEVTIKCQRDSNGKSHFEYMKG